MCHTKGMRQKFHRLLILLAFISIVLGCNSYIVEKAVFSPFPVKEPRQAEEVIEITLPPPPPLKNEKTLIELAKDEYITIWGLRPISLENASNYTIFGSCIDGFGVTLTVRGEDFELECDNARYALTLDMSFIEEHPILFEAKQVLNGIERISQVYVDNHVTTFVTVWELDSHSIFVFPIKDPDKSDYNWHIDFWVDWGDGTPIKRVTSFDDIDLFHKYETSGKYTIVCLGSIGGFSNTTGYQRNLTKVINIGPADWIDLSSAFKDNLNLHDVYGGMFRGLKTTRAMFMGAHSAYPRTKDWGLANVVDMSLMFYGAHSLNPDVAFWDVSSVENMSYMFHRAVSANPDVSEWDVSAVENFRMMFSMGFSGDIDVSNWDVSAATDMNSMFYSSGSNPEVTDWNVSNVLDFSFMFYKALQASPNILDWDVSEDAVHTGIFKRMENAPEFPPRR